MLAYAYKYTSSINKYIIKIKSPVHIYSKHANKWNLLPIINQETRESPQK